MQPPINPIAFILLGLATASLPYFGFPSAWETGFEIALGAFLIVMGLLQWWQRRSETEHHADTFVESKRDEHFRTTVESSIKSPGSAVSMHDVSVRATPAPAFHTPIVQKTSVPQHPSMPEKTPQKIIATDITPPSAHNAPSTTVVKSARPTRSRPRTVQKPADIQSASIPSPVRVRAPRRRSTKVSASVAAE